MWLSGARCLRVLHSYFGLQTSSSLYASVPARKWNQCFISQYHTSTLCYRTVNQIVRKGPIKPKPKLRGPLSGRPQLKGIILQTFIRKPKKPNSAQRKCCRVRLSNGKELTAFIPKEGHTLQEHNVVLVEGGRTQDVPGVKIKVIRGKYDCAHPVK